MMQASSNEIHLLYPKLQEKHSKMMESLLARIRSTICVLPGKLQQEPGAAMLDLNGFDDGIKGHALGVDILIREEKARLDSEFK